MAAAGDHSFHLLLVRQLLLLQAALWLLQACVLLLLLTCVLLHSHHEVLQGWALAAL
jgi:hypothetical protein